MNDVQAEREAEDVELQEAGISRIAPSAKPMYQSGCEPAVTGEGSYGPYIQIGLIVTSAAMQRR